MKMRQVVRWESKAKSDARALKCVRFVENGSPTKKCTEYEWMKEQLRWRYQSHERAPAEEFVQIHCSDRSWDHCLGKDVPNTACWRPATYLVVKVQTSSTYGKIDKEAKETIGC